MKGEDVFADIALCGAPDDFEMRIATSFISVGQARQNLKELDGKTLDDVKNAAADKWEQILRKIEIEADEEVKKRPLQLPLQNVPFSEKYVRI